MRAYGLVRPCPKCPFRTDVPPYLQPERVTQIATDVQNGGGVLLPSDHDRGS